MTWFHILAPTLSVTVVHPAASSQPSLEPTLKTIKLTLTNLQSIEKTVAPGTSFAGFKFSLAVKDSTDPPADVSSQETTVTFTDAAPGTYVASVVPVDQNGQSLGTEQSIEVVVPVDDIVITVQQPGGLEAAVA